ncbi:hypothetical protein GCM10028807_58570 [Spirosoma daeguense]
MNWSDGQSYVSIGIAVFLVNQVRAILDTKTRLPVWDFYFQKVWLVGFGLMALGEIFPEPWRIWFWLIIFGAVAYTTRQLRELRMSRTILLAIAPYTALIFVRDVIKFVTPSFYKSINSYLESASVFAVIWLVTFLFIARNQKKTLEKDQLEREQEAQQRRIIEAKKDELEYQVSLRTAEITHQKEELEKALVDLKATQTQLIHSEKMASLGELTAGIAHEIQNPLNFVNNFSEVSIEIIEELAEEQAKPNRDTELEAELLADLKQNLQKITHHGGRASSIVKGMLQHSRAGSGQREPADLNALADEYLRLAYHGLRAKDKTFNATLNTDFDKSLGKVSVLSQDLGRVLLNLFTNAFYAVQQRKKNQNEPGYQPTVTVTTRCTNKRAVITVHDNGTGMPEAVQQKIFQPFFTTKPTGEGTGLGLSLSYDIVTKGHNGTINVVSKEGEGTTFTITLPA